MVCFRYYYTGESFSKVALDFDLLFTTAGVVLNWRSFNQVGLANTMLSQPVFWRQCNSTDLSCAHHETYLPTIEKPQTQRRQPAVVATSPCHLLRPYHVISCTVELYSHWSHRQSIVRLQCPQWGQAQAGKPPTFIWEGDRAFPVCSTALQQPAVSPLYITQVIRGVADTGVAHCKRKWRYGLEVAAFTHIPVPHFQGVRRCFKSKSAMFNWSRELLNSPGLSLTAMRTDCDCCSTAPERFGADRVNSDYAA